jgi:hypothetical protein
VLSNVPVDGFTLPARPAGEFSQVRAATAGYPLVIGSGSTLTTPWPCWSSPTAPWWPPACARYQAVEPGRRGPGRKVYAPGAPHHWCLTINIECLSGTQATSPGGVMTPFPTAASLIFGWVFRRIQD